MACKACTARLLPPADGAGGRVCARLRWARLLLLLGLAAPGLAAGQAVSNTATFHSPTSGDCPSDDSSCRSTAQVARGGARFNFCGSEAGQNIYSNYQVAAGGSEFTQKIFRMDSGNPSSEVPLPQLDALIPYGLETNGLMLDKANNRLLSVIRLGGSPSRSQLWATDGGGWYPASEPFATANIPRGGMLENGEGYLITGETTPRAWHVRSNAAPGDYPYTVSNAGPLTIIGTPTSLTSGDIAFSQDGKGYMVMGADIWELDFSGSITATQLVRPQYGGAPIRFNLSGVAFGFGDNLYVSTVGGGGNEDPTSNYYQVDLSTGVMVRLVGGTGSRDLASCVVPRMAETTLTMRKQLALINGVPAVAGAHVRPGDILTYRTRVAAQGAAARSLYEHELIETVPANTSYHASADNDFVCETGGPDAGSCRLKAVTAPIQGGQSIDLDFMVRVDDPLPADVLSIRNTITSTVAECEAADACTTEHPLGPDVTVVKNALPVSGTQVRAGDAIAYTLQVNVVKAVTTADVVLTDTFGPGLELDPAVPLPAACRARSDGTPGVACTLPPPLAVGSLTLTYGVRVRQDAQTGTGGVENRVVPSGDDRPRCTSSDECRTQHALVEPTVTVNKASVPASGTRVPPGAQIDYTVTVTVADSATTDAVTLADTLDAGLVLTGTPSFTGTGASGQCSSGNARQLTCTLAAPAPPGTYVFAYAVQVEATATGTIGNQVGATGDDRPTCVTCDTEHEVLPTRITVEKTSDPVTDTQVRPGQTITYTLRVTVADSATTGAVTLTDTLSGSLTRTGTPAFAVDSGAGSGSCSGDLQCTLQAGALPGVYRFTYQATVDAAATGTVGNRVEATGPDNPGCASCSTGHEVAPARVSVTKSSVPASGSQVSPGQVIDYTVTVTVADAITRDAVLLDDVFDPDLTLEGAPAFAVDSGAGSGSCSGSLRCTLQSGALPGTYRFTYSARVAASATGHVGNQVTPSGGDNPVCSGSCGTLHPLVPSGVAVTKSSDPASGTRVVPGQTINYTLQVAVTGSATTGAVTLTDTLSGSLTRTGDRHGRQPGRGSRSGRSGLRQLQHRARGGAGTGQRDQVVRSGQR